MKKLLSPAEIANTAQRLGLSDDQIAREILQAKILSAIFHGQTRHLILKGGLAMRQIHQSQRLTKDIDFSAAEGASSAAVARVVRGAIETALASGFLDNIKVTAPKQTDATQRWKINGRIAGGESVVQLTVEVSRRGTPPAEYVDAIPIDADPSGPPSIIQVFKPVALAAGKVAALTDPKREAPRDIYDLDLLISLKVEPPVRLLAQMGTAALDQALDTVWEKIELMDWKRARPELRDFLPRDAMEALTQDAWDGMRLRVGENVEAWLQGARDLAGDDKP